MLGVTMESFIPRNTSWFVFILCSVRTRHVLIPEDCEESGFCFVSTLLEIVVSHSLVRAFVRMLPVKFVENQPGAGWPSLEPIQDIFLPHKVAFPKAVVLIGRVSELEVLICKMSFPHASKRHGYIETTFPSCLRWCWCFI